VFDVIDADMSGEIEAEELVDAMNEMSAEKVTEDLASELLKEVRPSISQALLTDELISRLEQICRFWSNCVCPFRATSAAIGGL